MLKNNVIAFHPEKEGNFYVASVLLKPNGGFQVRSRYVENGKVRNDYFEDAPDDEHASRRLLRMVQKKCQRKGFKVCSDSQLLTQKDGTVWYGNHELSRFLAPENSVSNQELLSEAQKIVASRLVTFRNVAGLERSFNEDVEYIGFYKGEGFFEVIDRFGELQTVSEDRFSSVKLTEEADQLFHQSPKLYEKLVGQIAQANPVNEAKK